MLCPGALSPRGFPLWLRGIMYKLTQSARADFDPTLLRSVREALEAQAPSNATMVVALAELIAIVETSDLEDDYPENLLRTASEAR